MKKYYIPDNPPSLIAFSLFFLFGLLTLYGAVRILILTFSQISESTITDTLKRFGIAMIFLVPTFAMVFKFSQYICYTIILDKEKVYIHNDNNFERSKIQYYACIRYKDIQNIDIIWSTKKSNGKKSYESSIIAGSEPIPYLLLKNKNGERCLFMIFYTTKRNTIKLIDDIKKRMILCGNLSPIKETADIINNLEINKKSHRH